MNEADDFLAHYGVKGMKWGVRKRDDAKGGSGKKTAGQRLNQSKFGDMSRKSVTSSRARMKKRNMTPEDRKAARASEKQAASQAKAKVKATRSGARGAIGSDLGGKFNLKTRDGKIRTGATTAGLILGAPAAERYLGYELSKSAGYSTGKSAAIGLLGGTVGGLAAAEISVRKKARA